MERREAAALDRHLTRDPFDTGDADQREYVCRCGKPLSSDPSFLLETTKLVPCSGKVSGFECRYDDGTHEAILRILGEEHRGESYTVAYSAECGTQKGDRYGSEETEINPLFSEEWTHAPHFFVEPDGASQIEVRVCSDCDHHNAEIIA